MDEADATITQKIDDLETSTTTTATELDTRLATLEQEATDATNAIQSDQSDE